MMRALHALPEPPRSARQSIRGLPPLPIAKPQPGPSQPTQPRDFWIPQVTESGQIYYSNTLTGQVASELPTEADEDELSNGGLAGLTSSVTSRRDYAGTGLGLVNGPYFEEEPLVTADFPHPSVSPAPPARSPAPYARTPTLTPQIDQYTPSGLSLRREQIERPDSAAAQPSFVASGSAQQSSPFIAPDAPMGRPRASTFDVSASPPPPSSNRHSNRVPGVLFDSLTASIRSRPFSPPGSDRSSTIGPSVSRRPSDGDLQISLPHAPRASMVRKRSRLPVPLPSLPDVREHPSSSSSSPLPITSTPSSTRSYSNEPTSLISLSLQDREPTPMQILNKPPPTLQGALSPDDPELTSELLHFTRTCIHAVVNHLQDHGVPRQRSDEDAVDSMISIVISSMRDLLYVSGPGFGPIPSSVLLTAGSDSRDQRNSSTASQTHLIPAQRRAIATLSKFVLSARAVLNEGPWRTSYSISHLLSDAEELERSVMEFVRVVHRYRDREVHGDQGFKRLNGYLTAPHASPGKAGAGVGGGWKGYGWAHMDDNEEAPRRSLDNVTFHEFGHYISLVQSKSSTLGDVMSDMEPAPVIAAAQALVQELSSLLDFLSDVHIARHVDISPVQEDRLSDGAQYVRLVDRARVFVRSFEANTQALYDDSALLFSTAQRVSDSRKETYDELEAINDSLDFNLQLVRQTFENLLRVGQEQAVILEQSHRTPLEWRMSQISTGNSQRSLVDASLDDPFGSQGDSLNGTSERDRNNTVNDGGSSPIPPPVPSASSKPTFFSNAPWKSEEDLVGELGKARLPPRGEKIKKIFGDDAPEHYILASNADSKPWYLRPNYDSRQILIDPDGIVRGGTKQALVERLTAHEYSDWTFNRAFLMTFKSFISLDELFKLLVERFWIQPPQSLNAAELVDWREHKQHVIRSRVIKILKAMVQDEEILEKDDLYILDRMQDFASREDVMTFWATKQLLTAIKEVQQGRGRKPQLAVNVPPPPPIAPKKIELLDIDPMELARQLTITESQLFQRIPPSECLQRSKVQKTDYQDNIANFIRRSTMVTHWVEYAILSRDDPRKRASVMKHIIQVADRCRFIQNFSTMLAITSGLNSSAVRRLKRSWEQVGAKYISLLDSCETSGSSYKNFSTYRIALGKVTPPCIPFLGVFLTALTHVQDGMKDNLPGDLVNFGKRQKASEVIQELQRYQIKPYNFHPLPSVLVYIDDCLGQFKDKDVSDTFWNLSLEREPREKEEEKLARLLHESGFF
ncbi:ras GEF [Coniophora puteana RWD-64-598 SS2]|uniref:Ras GEF n=1 Tax=Coniophora puteana (strain RWD-64-598) TaxID=741705 RepID=A0A5M3MPY1_CONPW|nr:ras GEF [Coniophora puteana RWD-64-598 SS2]EIW81242.1 ras GEF [Coniophora puteana RWD-64-598 SS2]